MDRQELMRLDTFVSAIDRVRYASAHVLVRLILSERLGISADLIQFDRRCERCGQSHGKPAVVGHQTQISLSTSGDRVMVAVTDTAPVGVDVEAVGGVDFSGFDAVALAGQEQAIIDHLPHNTQKRARVIYWTRKEAVLKASGLGLVVPPDQVLVGPPFDPAELIKWPAAASPFQLADLRVGDDYAAALAVESRLTLQVRLNKVDGLTA